VDDDDTPESGVDQSGTPQIVPAQSVAPVDSDNATASVQIDGDMNGAVDAVFMAYSEADSAIVSDDAAAPQVAHATALAGILLALGLRQGQRRSEPESTTRRRAL
jgi:hypothetical protein